MSSSYGHSVLMRYLAEGEDGESSSKPWGDVIAASLIIQLATFTGLLLTGALSCWSRMSKNGNLSTNFVATLHRLAIPSFAAGALLATVVFLLIPESIEQLTGAHDKHDEGATAEEGEEGHEEHGESFQWKFGTAMLGGFLFPIVTSALFPPPEPDECEACRERARRERREESMRLSQAAVESRVLSGIKEEKVQDLAKGGDESVTRTMKDCCDTGECRGRHSGRSFDGNEFDSGRYSSDNEDVDDLDEVDKVPINMIKKEDEEEKGSESEKEEDDDETTVSSTPRSVNWSLVASILMGDAVHNFTDGIFLGNAFLLCSREVAYTLAAVTVFHELAQEIADFALLTHHCGLSTWKALLLNFLSGFSVMIGAVLILSLDMSEFAIGILLAISAGVYVYIAAVECIPRCQTFRKTARHTLIYVLCFVLGAVPIGLVLLNHGHCEADDGHDEDAHADEHAEEEHDDHDHERWF